MTPDFDLQGGLLLAAVRGASVAALLSAFGAVVFGDFVIGRALVGAAPQDAAACRRRLLIVAQASALVGVLACLAWLVVQAGDLADAEGIGGALAAVPLVVRTTSFGHVLAGQLLALLVLIVVLGWRDNRWRLGLALIPATAALVLQAGHSHAASMYEGPSMLLGCDILHLLGAGAWLGCLLPLWVVVRGSPPGVGAAAARWFSPLGQVCIAALIVSAAVQGWVLVASVPGLVGTAYGWLVLVKSVLFVVLLGFAAANRYRFAPALGHEKSDAARARLVRSLALQTAAGLAMVVAAAVLSDLPPAMHGQALWPFRQRFSLDTGGFGGRRGAGRGVGAGVGGVCLAAVPVGVGGRGGGGGLVRGAAFQPAAGGCVSDQFLSVAYRVFGGGDRGWRGAFRRQLRGVPRGAWGGRWRSCEGIGGATGGPDRGAFVDAFGWRVVLVA
jgi:putative copper resistance protein D